MSEYFDTVEIRVEVYDGLPQPEDVTEGWIFDIYTEDEVDRLALVQEIAENIQPESYVLDDKGARHSWGAEASFLEIVVGVASTFGGLQALVTLIEKIATRLGQKGLQLEMNAEVASEASKRYLAKMLRVEEEGVEILSAEPTTEGVEVTAKAAQHTFLLELNKSGIHRLRRIG